MRLRLRSKRSKSMIRSCVNFFRRPTQKQYDGPAANNIDNKEWNTSHDQQPRPRSTMTSDAAKNNDHRPRQQQRYSSSNDHDRGRRRSSTSGRPSSSSDNRNKVDRNVPLASGISSRRTSVQVKKGTCHDMALLWIVVVACGTCKLFARVREDANFDHWPLGFLVKVSTN